jgi:hypothetical protein
VFYGCIRPSSDAGSYVIIFTHLRLIQLEATAAASASARSTDDILSIVGNIAEAVMGMNGSGAVHEVYWTEIKGISVTGSNAVQILTDGGVKLAFVTRSASSASQLRQAIERAQQEAIWNM